MSKLKSIVFVLGVLAAVPLAECRPEGDLPAYQMEPGGDYSEVLCIDGALYQRDLSGGWDEQAHSYSDGAQYVWTPAEGIGEQIGVCGADVDKGGGFAIYEIVSDGGRTFLYTASRKFYSSGVESRLWMRDGVTLEAPAAEMVSSITVISENAESTSAQADGPVIIAALLEVYNGDSVQTPRWRGLGKLLSDYTP